MNPESHSGVTQKVVIVNGTVDMLESLQTVLHAGRYDIVFVEAMGHAYSQIKRVQPNLVILCLCLDDPNGFQLLSMLTLDNETRGIPVITYAADNVDEEMADEFPEPSETEMFASKPPAVWMH